MAKTKVTKVYPKHSKVAATAPKEAKPAPMKAKVTSDEMINQVIEAFGELKVGIYLGDKPVSKPALTEAYLTIYHRLMAIANPKKFVNQSPRNVLNSIVQKLVEMAKDDEGIPADSKLQVTLPAEYEDLMKGLTAPVLATIKSGKGNQMTFVSMVKALISSDMMKGTINPLSDKINTYRKKQFSEQSADELKESVAGKFADDYKRIAAELMRNHECIQNIISFAPKASKSKKVVAPPPEDDSSSDSEAEAEKEAPKPVDVSANETDTEDEATQPLGVDDSDDETEVELTPQVVKVDKKAEKAAKKAEKKAKKAEKKAAKKAKKKAAK